MAYVRIEVLRSFAEQQLDAEGRVLASTGYQAGRFYMVDEELARRRCGCGTGEAQLDSVPEQEGVDAGALRLELQPPPPPPPEPEPDLEDEPDEPPPDLLEHLGEVEDAEPTEPNGQVEPADGEG